MSTIITKNPFVKLSELEEKERHEEKLEKNIDTATTHDLFDSLWRNLAVKWQDKQLFRTSLYKLWGGVLAAELNDVTGVKNPFTGGQHIGAMTNMQRKKCKQFVMLLAKKYRCLSDLATNVSMWSNTFICEGKKNPRIQKELDNDIFISELRTKLGIENFKKKPIKPILPEAEPKDNDAINYYLEGLEAAIEASDNQNTESARAENKNKMLQCFQKAVELNHAEAAWYLWEYYSSSSAEKSNNNMDAAKYEFNKALSYLDIAECGGYLAAAIKITSLYHLGYKTPFLQNLEAKATKNNATCEDQYNLALYYTKVSDITNAEKFYKKAIENSSIPAQLSLIELYLRESDVLFPSENMKEQGLDILKQHIAKENEQAKFIYAYGNFQSAMRSYKILPLPTKETFTNPARLLKEMEAIEEKAYRDIKEWHKNIKTALSGFQIVGNWAEPLFHTECLLINSMKIGIEFSSTEITKAVNYLTALTTKYLSGNTGLDSELDINFTTLKVADFHDDNVVNIACLPYAINALQEHYKAKYEANKTPSNEREHLHWNQLSKWIGIEEPEKIAQVEIATTKNLILEFLKGRREIPAIIEVKPHNLSKTIAAHIKLSGNHENLAEDMKVLKKRLDNSKIVYHQSSLTEIAIRPTPIALLKESLNVSINNEKVAKDASRLFRLFLMDKDDRDSKIELTDMTQISSAAIDGDATETKPTYLISADITTKDSDSFEKFAKKLQAAKIEHTVNEELKKISTLQVPLHIIKTAYLNCLRPSNQPGEVKGK